MPWGPERCHSAVWRTVFTLVAAVFLLPAALPGDLAANTISTISRSHSPDGNTVITIACTDSIRTGSFRTFEIDNPPRAVVALEGITESMDPGELWIGDSHIEKVRLIHHQNRRPPELLVVLDATSDLVTILDLRADDNRLVIIAGIEPQPVPPAPHPVSPAVPTPGPGPLSAPPTATASPAPTQTPAIEPTPSAVPERATPTPSATPTPTLTPTPTPAATATIEPSPSPTPMPTTEPAAAVPPTPDEPSSPRPEGGPSDPAGLIALTSPSPSPGDGSKVIKVSTSNRGDGTTLLRISAGGPLPPACARHMAVTGDPPRIVVTMRGVSAPDLPRSLEFEDANVSRIRLIHDVETPEGELHMVLQPARPGVRIGEMKQLGPHLVVVLEPPGDAAEQ